ncbi:response regulator [Sphingomonas morindae]|uniref:Response regulator n=1 Tax=Sphingomonas morindae TaxID=1541170 RepID=A0ABY4XAA0_9SPHN|nr:response regulator [Sphingomonas morindae]USI73800.1 response regulator [Sphingomonas morindae]
MTGAPLRGCRLLVVEDEYFLAQDLRDHLTAAGATVIGPVGLIDEAVALIVATDAIDGAILDVNLQGEPAFPAADLLTARGVPILFTTGYDGDAMPERYRHMPRCEKPVPAATVIRAIGAAVRGGR